MPSINGMHADNPESAYDWPLWVRRVVGRDGSLTMLDLKFRDGENGYWWQRLLDECPDAAISIRCYPDADYYYNSQLRWKGRNWYQLRPLDQLTAWVQECIWRLSHVRGPDGLILPLEKQPIMCSRVIVIGSNEKELRVEGHPLGAWYDPGRGVNYPYVSTQVYEEAGQFDCEFIRLFRELAPWAKCLLGAGAYAGGHNAFDAPPGQPARGDVPWSELYPPDYEYQLPAVKRSIEMCDVFITHAYCYPDGAGSKPDGIGYWSGCRELRPARYDQDVQSKPLQHGLYDPGGFHSQYPTKIFFRAETGTGAHSDPSRTDITLVAIDSMNRALSSCGKCAGNTVFIWNAGPEHQGNRIWPNESLRYRIGDLPRYPRAALPSKSTGGDTVDRLEALLTDMWARQGVKPAKGADAFWAYALAQARQGRIIVPQASRDGNYYNSDDPRYVIAYTLPVPLWCEKNVWQVHEGFPPF